jgi:hypothetical protein
MSDKKLSIALAHKHYDKTHLAEVIEQMKIMGAPKIKAVYMPCWDMYAALEGCHRIRAAKEMGLIPEIIELDYDTVCDLDITDKSLGLDIDNPGTTVGQFCDDSYRSTIIDF